VNLNLDKDYQNSDIDTLKQKYDDKISFKSTVKYNIELEIPEGYSMKKIPVSVDYSHESFSFKSSYNFDPKTNKILYEKQIIVNSISISPDQFSAWNQMVKKMCESYAQAIILEKK